MQSKQNKQETKWGGRSKRSERARADTDEAKKGTKEKRRGTGRGNNVKDLWTISAMHAHTEKMHSYHVRRGLINRQKQISAVTAPQTLSAVRNKHFVTSKKKRTNSTTHRRRGRGLRCDHPAACHGRPARLTGTNVNARVPTRDIERGKRRSRSSRRRRGGGGGCSSNERTKGEEGSGKQRKGEAQSSN